MRLVAALVAVVGVALGGDASEAGDPAWGLEEVAAALYRFERVNDFFTGKGTVAPPEWWAVRNASDVRVDDNVAAHGVNKKISRGTIVVDGHERDVIVKSPLHNEFLEALQRRKRERREKQRKQAHDHRALTPDNEFGEFYTELLYLEYVFLSFPRGRRCVPAGTSAASRACRRSTAATTRRTRRTTLSSSSTAARSSGACPWARSARPASFFPPDVRSAPRGALLRYAAPYAYFAAARKRSLAVARAWLKLGRSFAERGGARPARIKLSVDRVEERAPRAQGTC